MIVWTNYMRYRAQLRGFELDILEQIINHSTEHYYDTETGRPIVIGRHKNDLVLLPYDRKNDTIIPITVHVTTRQQINFRLKMKRFIHE